MTLFCISLSFFSWNKVLLCEIIWCTLSQRYYLCFLDSAGLAVKMWLIRVDGGRGDYAFTLRQMGNKYIIVLHILYLLWLSLFSSKLFLIWNFSVWQICKKGTVARYNRSTQLCSCEGWGKGTEDKYKRQNVGERITVLMTWDDGINGINPSWVGVVERKCSVHLGKPPCSLSL